MKKIQTKESIFGSMESIVNKRTNLEGSFNKKEYYQKNKDKKKEYQKEYNLKNKEKIKEQKKEYYLKNKT